MPELKSGETEFSSSPLCEAAELVDSPRGNVYRPRSSSPAAAQSHFCQASNVQPKLNEEMPQFSPSDSPVSFLSFLERFVSSAEAVHVGLGRFFTLSLQPHSRTVHGAPACSDLWPCPLPTWEWTGSTRLSPRRRKLRKRLKLRHSLLQLVVATLNWETLGHPISPPPQACTGFVLTEEQWAMINRLERLVDHFVQAGPISSQSLGRSCEKFSNLPRTCQELPGNQEVDLDELVFDLASKLDPYSSKPTSVDQHNMASSCDLNPPSPSPCSPPDAGRSLGETRVPKSVAKPVISSRIKWEHSPNFDPTPYLVDPIVKDAFVDPARVRLPSHMWPEQPRGRVHCSKQELLGLACKWDTKGACRIFRLDEINWDEAVGLFAVPKDDQYDRLILNPQTVNSRMQSFSHYTKQLAPGSMFSLIHLKPGYRLRISADDLAEMYYTVRVPTARAKRNCIGKLFDAAELRHLSCFDSSKHYGPCVLALSALAMGDSWAVEIAQQAHCNVLRFLAGSMLDSERVCYRHPFPCRSDFMEWLSIDDHIGIQVVTENQFRNRVPLRDTAVFLGAERAYQTVKLVQHPKKKQREVSQGVFLGAEVDGKIGFVSAPRHRISVLMMCTVLVARRGTASRRLLASLLGCWIHVLMFRRAVLAVVSHAFTDGIERPDGAGICQSPESESVVQELWRHSEQRGYYTQLLTPAASVLSSLGESFEEPIPSIQPSDRDVVLKIPCSLSEGILFDCIELFRSEGNWSLAHEAAGFRVHDGFDVDGRSLVTCWMIALFIKQPAWLRGVSFQTGMQEHLVKHMGFLENRH